MAMITISEEKICGCRWRIKMISISERKYFSSTPTTRFRGKGNYGRDHVLLLSTLRIFRIGFSLTFLPNDHSIYSHFVHTLAFNLMTVLRNPALIDFSSSIRPLHLLWPMVRLCEWLVVRNWSLKHSVSHDRNWCIAPFANHLLPSRC